MKMIAKVPLLHRDPESGTPGTRHVKAGDTFEASEKTAKSLVEQNEAEPAPEPKKAPKLDKPDDGKGKDTKPDSPPAP